MQVKSILDALPPGLTHFLIHPAKDSPELRRIVPGWRARVADYEAFTDPGLRAYVRRSGIHVIGYRAIRDAMRSVSGLAQVHMESRWYESHCGKR